MTIKNRLLILLAMVAVGLISEAGIVQFGSSDLLEHEEQLLMVSQVNSEISMLRRNEEYFLSRLDLTHVQNFHEQYDRMQARIERLLDSLNESGLETTSVQDMRDKLTSYHDLFVQLVEVQQHIGLTPKDGLYGSLRKTVHELEASLKDNQQAELTVQMLMLRRHEKDFMLRRDMKYIAAFDKELAAMKQSFLLVHDAELKALVNKKLDGYSRDFHALVSAEQGKGLQPKEGLQGQLGKAVEATDASLDTMNSRLNEQVEDAKAQLQWMIGMVSGALFLLLVGMIFALIRTILRPVNALQQVMSQVRNNEDLTLRADVSGRDEITSMARNFNALLEDFRTLILEVNRSSEQLSTASVDLSVITEQTSTSMAEQLQETGQVATAVEEMSATVQEVARNTSDTARATEEATQSAGQGKQVVDETVRCITALASEVKRAVEVVSNVDKESSEIGRVLDVINGIAEQTNLLALNAAIEAARAGEQGRGFAVVADEVRTLAQRTQDATGEIEDLISSLQNGAHEAVKVMEAGSNQVEKAVTMAEGADSALDAIKNTVSDIHQMTMQIASAAEEQGTVAQEVASNVVNIKQNADVTGESVHHIASASEDLSALAKRLHQQVKRFTV